MKDKVWSTGEKPLVANVDKSRSTTTEERKLELLNNLLNDTYNLHIASLKAYNEFNNSDLDSCTLRLKQNIDQLKKIKNSFNED